MRWLIRFGGLFLPSATPPFSVSLSLSRLTKEEKGGLGYLGKVIALDYVTLVAFAVMAQAVARAWGHDVLPRLHKCTFHRQRHPRFQYHVSV